MKENDFTVERQVVTPDGEIKTQSINIEAPFVGLVPIPAFSVEEPSIDFDMEIQKTETNTDVDTDEASCGEGSFQSGWGIFGVEIEGEVKHSEERRSSDASAKYEIHSHAVQQPHAEKMAEMISLFKSAADSVED